MSRSLITLWNESDRERARKAIADAPFKMRVQFIEEARSIPQNARLWLILSEIAKNLVWHGQKYSEGEWKDFFMHALRGEKWMPAEEGGMIPIGRSTSKLSKHEFGELMELMQSFCARQNIKLPWDEIAA